MTTLIIPDVHNKHRVAQRIIDSEKHDRVVLLGDYFDDFGDNPTHVQHTAEWLKACPHEKLMGNHDLPYRWPNNHALTCSGFSHPKSFAINSVMNAADWEKMGIYTYVDSWLLSHAGFAPEMIYYQPDVMKQAAVECLYAASHHKDHSWLHVSRVRGGLYKVAGPFWQDWREVAVTEQNQLFGHTPDPAVRQRDWKPSMDSQLYHSVCLDTHLHHYALITDDKLEIRETPIAMFKK